MIFADSSYWIALVNARDRHHEEARLLGQRHADQTLVTTNHVRGESWTYLRRKAGHTLALRFLDRLDRSPRVRVVFVDERLEADALRWLRRHDEREYSFVGATSFAMMKSARLREVFAFDEDFSAAGFRPIRTR